MDRSPLFGALSNPRVKASFVAALAKGVWNVGRGAYRGADAVYRGGRRLYRATLPSEKWLSEATRGERIAERAGAAAPLALGAYLLHTRSKRRGAGGYTQPPMTPIGEFPGVVGEMAPLATAPGRRSALRSATREALEGDGPPILQQPVYPTGPTY